MRPNIFVSVGSRYRSTQPTPNATFYIKSGSIELAPALRAASLTPPNPLSHQGRGGARYKSDTSGHNISLATPVGWVIERTYYSWRLAENFA